MTVSHFRRIEKLEEAVARRAAEAERISGLAATHDVSWVVDGESSDAAAVAIDSLMRALKTLNNAAFIEAHIVRKRQGGRCRYEVGMKYEHPGRQHEAGLS